jgi:hypothetical protein
MSAIKVFCAYAAEPAQIGQTISAAISELKQYTSQFDISAWPQIDIAGRFIIEGILDKISAADLVVVDITRLNFNVTFEAGYAIGKGKRIVPIMNSALQPATKEISELGIFDTLGYKTYESAGSLRKVLAQIHDTKPITLAGQALNHSAPVYLVDTLHKTDTALRVTSRIKKARISYRSFDPKEQPRLSALDAYRNVASSIGVIVNLLSPNTTDFNFNNLRGAFVAGLAHGMGRECLILQEGDQPVPVDYRDLVSIYRHPNDIDGYIGDLAPRVFEGLQEAAGDRPQRTLGLLEKLDLGAPAAENEMGNLSAYYVETDEYSRTLSGSVRLAVGRKGSGKTALFLRVRDRVRRDRSNAVLDLRPDGHQLKRFKHMVLNLLAEAAQEHVAKAFWEYLLLLEIAYKLLEKDRERHLRDSTLLERYQKLDEVYRSYYRSSEGDFSERMLELVERINGEFAEVSGGASQYLSSGQVTQLIYKHNVPKLQDALAEYLDSKGEVWILFDNIDKGWPTHGVEPADILILRSLLDATRHIEQHFARHNTVIRTVVFLRNDVYEILLSETPDRGKESRASLDWTDPDLLKEFLRRRIVSNEGFDQQQTFEEAWRQICTSHVHGNYSAEYLIERSLMRPRNLLTLVNYCKSNAVNLSHPSITVDDIVKACESYSADFGIEIGLEVRDVFPEAADVLYYFIDCKPWLNLAEIKTHLARSRIPESNWTKLIELLCWFSFLGVVRQAGNDIEETYIYNLHYDMKKFRRIASDFSDEGTAFCIHKAFWPFLEIKGS